MGLNRPRDDAGVTASVSYYQRVRTPTCRTRTWEGRAAAWACLCCGFSLEPGPSSGPHRPAWAQQWGLRAQSGDLEPGCCLVLLGAPRGECWGAPSSPVWRSDTEGILTEKQETKRGKVPMPFSCPKVQKGHQCRAPHCVSPHGDTVSHTGISHR